MSVQLHLGDCLDVMQGMPENSIDSIVTDPPYGLEFMGKEWDYGVPGVPFWEAALRVAKPGAHLLAFGGTRTWHRLAAAIEDAGWEIRDTVMWVYGSGFPKSLDVSKAIDKAAGAEREVVGHKIYAGPAGNNDNFGVGDNSSNPGKRSITAPATPKAAQWDGWGTALKPAWEPIIVARKPLCGTVAANVLEWGTGAIWIDGCRVEMANNDKSTARARNLAIQGGNFKAGRFETDGVMAGGHSAGRWPANLILSYPQDEHDAAGNPLPNPGKEEVVGCFPMTGSGAFPAKITGKSEFQWRRSANGNGKPFEQEPRKTDSGSSARYFQHCPWDENDEATRLYYCAKASRSERNAGLGGMPENGKVFNGKSDHNSGKAPGSVEDKFSTQPQQNQHPCCKPLSLMQYLCRLITPPNGTVLDPFLGSGTTGCASILEGFNFTGIEMETDYLDIARARIAWAEEQKCERDQAQAIADAQLKLL